MVFRATLGIPLTDAARHWKMRLSETSSGDGTDSGFIRGCTESDTADMLAIINEAAEAYRGVIPSDCFHDPYMPEAELRAERRAGVEFVGYEVDGNLVGVMGIQPVGDVDLVRHAYVRSVYQGRRIGSALLAHLRARSQRRILIGTWADATWAIAFYERHGFALVPPGAKADLLRTYWTVSERQIHASVVLAFPPLASA